MGSSGSPRTKHRKVLSDATASKIVDTENEQGDLGGMGAQRVLTNNEAKSINERRSEEYQRTTKRRLRLREWVEEGESEMGREIRGVKLSKKYGYILINNEERNGVPAIHTLSDASPFKRDMIFTLDMEKNEKLVQQKVTDPRSTNPEKNAEKSKYF